MPLVSINKPLHITSYDVVQHIKRITGITKVGHAGTLDPLASGVLVVGITREGTKQLHSAMETVKEYEATIRLGKTSLTDDEEGEKTIIQVDHTPQQNDIQQLLPEFIGTIWQKPPYFSAIKVGGKESYKLARKGTYLNLGKRMVTITTIEILSYSWPLLSLRVTCGAGVYIRSLARDLGERLGTGGYLTQLVRTRVGEYHIDDAIPLNEFESWWLNHEHKPS